MTLTTDLDEGLLTLTLDEPERRNPAGDPVRRALAAELARAEADDAVRAVVLTGAGGHFSVGGDIRDQGARSSAQHRERFAAIGDMTRRMAHFSKPLVAGVEGWAAGGGMGLALACPTIVAARGARFVASFTRIGLIPDMGVLATLPARIGPARARRLILSNRVVDADEALAIGLVDELCDDGAAHGTAARLALEEAEAAPLPRQAVLDWFARDLDAALDYERMVQPRLLDSADAAEGRAAFFEKRSPRYTGR